MPHEDWPRPLNQGRVNPCENALVGMRCARYRRRRHLFIGRPTEL